MTSFGGSGPQICGDSNLFPILPPPSPPRSPFLRPPLEDIDRNVHGYYRGMSKMLIAGFSATLWITHAAVISSS